MLKAKVLKIKQTSVNSKNFTSISKPLLQLILYIVGVSVVIYRQRLTPFIIFFTAIGLFFHVLDGNFKSQFYTSLIKPELSDLSKVKISSSLGFVYQIKKHTDWNRVEEVN